MKGTGHGRQTHAPARWGLQVPRGLLYRAAPPRVPAGFASPSEWGVPSLRRDHAGPRWGAVADGGASTVAAAQAHRYGPNIGLARLARTPRKHWQQPKLASGAFWLWYSVPVITFSVRVASSSSRANRKWSLKFRQACSCKLKARLQRMRCAATTGCNLVAAAVAAAPRFEDSATEPYKPRFRLCVNLGPIREGSA